MNLRSNDVTELFHSFPFVAVYSIKPSSESYNNFTQNSIIFYDILDREYFIKSYNFKTNHKGNISLKDESLSFNSKFRDLKIAGKPLESIKEIIFWNRIYYEEDNFYHIVLFSEKEKISVTRRLMEMNLSLNFKSDAEFNVERITDSINLPEIVENYGHEEIFTLNIEIPYIGPHLNFFSKGFTRHFEDMQFLVLLNDLVSTVNFEFISTSFKIDSRSFTEYFSSILSRIAPPNILIGRCEDDNCKIKLFFESPFKELLVHEFNIIAKKIDGIKINY